LESIVQLGTLNVYASMSNAKGMFVGSAWDTVGHLANLNCILHEYDIISLWCTFSRSRE